MLTQRRTVEWTVAVAVLALLIFVPLLREHRTAILMSYFAVLITVGLIRGKPEGIRFFFLSVAIATALAAVILVVYGFATSL
jgi:hypothetical protein